MKLLAAIGVSCSKNVASHNSKKDPVNALSYTPKILQINAIEKAKFLKA
jgi:hypothetical protein